MNFNKEGMSTCFASSCFVKMTTEFIDCRINKW